MEYLHTLPVSMDIEVNGTVYKLVHAAPAEDYDFESKYMNAIHFAVWRRLEAGDKLSRD